MLDEISPQPADAGAKSIASEEFRCRILFVTWDGPQVDYLEGLFLPIFVELRQHGIAFDVLQFHWGTKQQCRRVRAACERAGIGYRAVTVWRGPGVVGPFLTLLRGRFYLRKAVRRFGSSHVMPRSLMPALAVHLAGGARLRPIIFDADGLQADERVDVAGESARSLINQILRWTEKQTTRRAQSVLVRSAKAAAILAVRSGAGASNFHVVTNGRDDSLFRPFSTEIRDKVRKELGISSSSPLIVYSGSVGPQYRFDRIVEFALELASIRSDARLLVLSGSPELAREALGACAPLEPIIKRVLPQDVGKFLAAADLGLCFRQESLSSQAVAPLKLAEYLLCGLPVFGSATLGSARPALEAGVYLADRGVVAEGVKWLVEEILENRDYYRQQARAIGVEHFSLGKSVAEYLLAIRAADLPTGFHPLH